MSRQPAGLAAVVCILVFGMGQALAQDPPDGDVQFPPQQPRRPVAVIELGDFEGNRQLAEQLSRELNNHPDLKPIDSSLAEDALRERYEDEDAQWLKLATEYKRKAEDLVASYKFPDAASDADNGMFQLHNATPTPRVVTLSAELAFLLGTARLGERKDKLAAEAFRLARTINPEFQPDAIRYLPEVVQAFDAAVKAKPAGKGYIEVGPARGRIFLDGRAVFADGREIGFAPQTLTNVPAGLHVVWVVSPELDTRATRVAVEPDKKVKAEIEPALIDTRKKILRARLALKTAPDPAARASAMQNLARLVEVKDALLLTEANGNTIVQTWREDALGFSALREKKKDDKPGDLLVPLAPPKPIPTRKDPPPCPPGTSRVTPTSPCTKPIVIDDRRWYEKPRYQIAGGVGVVLLGAAIYALASWNRFFFNDQNPGFENPGLEMRR
jgi:hypothetical protein